jgi:hydrogenase maturation protease
MSTGDSHALVIGVGNAWAGDDAAGLLVARLVRERAPEGVTVIEHEGEPTALLDAWVGASLAIVVDATCGGGEPGAICIFEATHGPLPASFTGTSTHSFGLAEAIELARALGRLPERLVVVGIEGEAFEAGAVAGPEVTAALREASAEVLAIQAQHTGQKSVA